MLVSGVEFDTDTEADAGVGVRVGVKTSSRYKEKQNYKMADFLHNFMSIVHFFTIFIPVPSS